MKYAMFLNIIVCILARDVVASDQVAYLMQNARKKNASRIIMQIAQKKQDTAFYRQVAKKNTQQRALERRSKQGDRFFA